MYNRYIPQPDGTFRRNRIPDRCPPPPPQIRPPEERPCKQEACPDHKPPLPPPPVPPCPDNCPHKRPDTGNFGSIGGFLRQLLPKDFDTSDLLIVLLLLLMGGDCAEDQNTALLTLAIYLFL